MGWNRAGKDQKGATVAYKFPTSRKVIAAAILLGFVISSMGLSEAGHKKDVLRVTQDTLIDGQVLVVDKLIIERRATLTMNNSAIHVRKDAEIKDRGALVMRSGSALLVGDDLDVKDRGRLTMDSSILEVSDDFGTRERAALALEASTMQVGDRFELDGDASIVTNASAVTVLGKAEFGSRGAARFVGGSLLLNRSTEVEDRANLLLEGVQAVIARKLEIEDRSTLFVSGGELSLRGLEVENEGAISIFGARVVADGRGEFENRASLVIEDSEVIWTGDFVLEDKSTMRTDNATFFLNGTIRLKGKAKVEMNDTELSFTDPGNGLFVGEKTKGNNKAELTLRFSSLTHRAGFFDFVVRKGAKMTMQNTSVFHTKGSIDILSDAVLIEGSFIAEAERVGVHIISSSPTIRDSTISANEIGILIDGNSPVITGNKIEDNVIGIQVNSGMPTVTDNQFINNDGEAMNASAAQGGTYAGNVCVSAFGACFQNPPISTITVPAGETRFFNFTDVVVLGQVIVFGTLVVQKSKIYSTAGGPEGPNPVIFVKSGGHLQASDCGLFVRTTGKSLPTSASQVKQIFIEGSADITNCEMDPVEIRSGEVDIRSSKLYGVRVIDSTPTLFGNTITALKSASGAFLTTGGVLWDDLLPPPPPPPPVGVSGSVIDLNIKSNGDARWPYLVTGPSYTAQFGSRGETILTSGGASIMIQPGPVTVGGTHAIPLSFGPPVVAGTNISHVDVLAGLDYTRLAAYEGIMEFWTLAGPQVGGMSVAGGLDLSYSLTLPRRAEVRVAGAVTQQGTTMDASATGFEVWVDGRKVASVPPVRLWDAAGASGSAVLHVGVPEDRFPGPATVMVKVSGAWLADPARVYPVTIDPDFSGGTVTGDWFASSGTFRVLSQVTVTGTLTIHPGVRVEQQGEIIVPADALLRVLGTERDHVQFVWTGVPGPSSRSITMSTGVFPFIGGAEVELRYARFEGFSNPLFTEADDPVLAGSAVVTLRASNVSMSAGSATFLTGVEFQSEFLEVLVDHVDIVGADVGARIVCLGSAAVTKRVTLRNIAVEGGSVGALAGSGCFGTSTPSDARVEDSNFLNQTTHSVSGAVGAWSSVTRNFATAPTGGGVVATSNRTVPSTFAGVWHRGAAPVIAGPSQIDIGVLSSWSITATHPKESPMTLVVDFPPLLLPPQTFPIQSGDTVNVSRSFPAAGDFAVRAFTTDIYGIASDVTTFPFSVVAPNQNPIAVAKIDGADTATKLTFLAFEFNGSLSSDPDPGDQIVNWTWNFGDGSALSFGPVVTHNYTDHGLPFINGAGCRGFLATLTVRDNNGEIGTDSVSACLINRPAAIPALPDILAATGEVVTLDGSEIFDPEGHPVSVKWTLAASPLNPGPGLVLLGKTPQFTPGAVGTFYIALNATDDLGHGDDTYLKLVVRDADAPFFEGNTILDCAPGTPGLHVQNKPLVIQDTVIAGCAPGLKVENARAVFAESQITNTATVIQVIGSGKLDFIRQDWEATTLERQSAQPVQDVSTDTDGEGVKDFVEMFVRETNPLNATNPDRDGDGVHDHQEVAGAVGAGSLLPQPPGPVQLSAPIERGAVVTGHICYIDSKGDEDVRVCPPHQKGGGGPDPCISNCGGSGGGGTADPDFDGDGIPDGVETQSGALVLFEAEESPGPNGEVVVTQQSQGFRVSYVSPDVRSRGGFPGAYVEGKTGSGAVSEVVVLNNPFGGRPAGDYRVMIRASHPAAGPSSTRDFSMMIVTGSTTTSPTFGAEDVFKFFTSMPVSWSGSGSASVKITTADTDPRLRVDTLTVVPVGFKGSILNPRAVDTDFDLADDNIEFAPEAIWIEAEDLVQPGLGRYRIRPFASLGAVAQPVDPGNDGFALLTGVPSGTYLMFVKAQEESPILRNQPIPTLEVVVGGVARPPLTLAFPFTWLEVPGGPLTVAPATTIVFNDLNDPNNVVSQVQVDKVLLLRQPVSTFFSDPIDEDTDLDQLSDGQELRTAAKEEMVSISRFVNGGMNPKDGEWVINTLEPNGGGLDPWEQIAGLLSSFRSSYVWDSTGGHGDIYSPVISAPRSQPSDPPRPVSRDFVIGYQFTAPLDLGLASLKGRVCQALGAGPVYLVGACGPEVLLPSTSGVVGATEEFALVTVPVPHPMVGTKVTLKIEGFADSGVSARAIISSLRHGFGTDPFDLDFEDDGVTDGQERDLGSDPHDEDSDHDGIADGVERDVLGTKLLDPDSDRDGLEDGDEVLLGTVPQFGGHDTDGDGLSDGVEVDGLSNADPHLWRITVDGDEIVLRDFNTFRKDMNHPIFKAASNPFVRDSDGDSTATYRSIDFDEYFGIRRSAGIGGGTEIERREDFRTDPADPDTDSDGIADRRPVTGVSSMGEDDGFQFRVQVADLSTFPCQRIPTVFTFLGSPTDKDVDEDGLSDDVERLTSFTDPRVPDSDKGGLNDKDDPDPVDGCNTPDGDVALDTDADGIDNGPDEDLFVTGGTPACAGHTDVDSDGLPNGRLDDDTDGDELRDGDEKAYWEKRFVEKGGQFGPLGNLDADSRRNICDFDADDDGLEDGLELEGWETDVVSGKDQLISMVDTLCKPLIQGGEQIGCVDGGSGNIDSIISHRNVNSDPGVGDSDNDGLKDGDEFNAKSDPRNSDADGDALLDGEDDDPVLLEINQPVITIISETQEPVRDLVDLLGNFFKQRFVLEYTVEDEGAVASVKAERCVSLNPLKKASWQDSQCVEEGGGSLTQIVPLDSKTFLGKAGVPGARFVELSTKFEVTTLEAVALNSAMRITAKDAAGNEGETIKERPSFIAQGISMAISAASNFADKIVKAGLAALLGAAGAAIAGILSGLFEAFFENIRDTVQMLLNPVAMIDGIKMMIDKFGAECNPGGRFDTSCCINSSQSLLGQ